MKRMKLFLFALIALMGFWACSDDDESFSLPVIDGGTGAITLNVKRDTADVCKIVKNITSDAGLAKIELRNKTTNEVLNEVTTFSDPHNYTYAYSYDLTSFTQSVTLPLALTIVDKAGQSTSRDITINVLFSELKVKFATEGDIISQFEDCNIAFVVNKGVVPLKSVKVYIGENLIDTYELSTSGDQTQFNLNVLVTGLKMGDNVLKVVVQDDKNQEVEVTKTVKRMEAKTWKDLRSGKEIASNMGYGDGYMVSYSREIKINGFFPDDPDNYELPTDGALHRISLGAMDMNMMAFEFGVNFIGLEFEYTGELVSKLKLKDYEYGEMADQYSAYTGVKETVYQFEYLPNTEQLSKVTKDNAAYLTDFVYEGGNIISFKIDGKEYAPQYVEKDGEAVRVDCMGGDLANVALGDFTTKRVNPFYLPMLPAVLPLEFKELTFGGCFYNKYLFEKIGDTDYTVGDYELGEPYNGFYRPIQSITWQLGEYTVNFRYAFNLIAE